MDICHAISARKTISFHYDGHHRIVIPAAHGPQTSTGNNVLRGYQIGGTGKTRSIPFWDLFLVSKISNLTVLDHIFSDNPPFYRPGDKHIAPIHCEL